MRWSRTVLKAGRMPEKSLLRSRVRKTIKRNTMYLRIGHTWAQRKMRKRWLNLAIILVVIILVIILAIMAVA